MYNTATATTPNLNQFIVNALILNDKRDGQNLILFDCQNIVLVAEGWVRGEHNLNKKYAVTCSDSL